MDWPALLLLALLDSVNPSALVVALILLSRPGGAGAVVPYAMGIFVTYFVMGLALVGGFDLANESWGQAFNHPVAFAIELLLGLILLTIACMAPKDAPPSKREPVLGRRSLAGLFVLGLTVTAAELPTAFPYLAATGFLGTSDLGKFEVSLRLAVYCAIFVAPPLLLAAVQVMLGERAGPRYERLRERLQRGARETLLWLFGIAGFMLAGHGAIELAARLT